MAGFRKDKTTAAQTAANSAAVVTAAAIQKGTIDNGGEAAAEFAVVVFDALFDRLAPVVDADNEVFAAVDAEQAPAAPRASSGTSTKSRSSKTGGNKGRSSGGGKSSVTLGDALNTVLNFGAFEGETLAHLLDIGADEAHEDYGYRDGDADGRDYLAWLAGAKQKNDFIQRRARLVADDAGIEYEVD